MAILAEANGGDLKGHEFIRAESSQKESGGLSPLSSGSEWGALKGHEFIRAESSQKDSGGFSPLSSGSEWGPVILPVFKTGGRQVCPVAGVFDSHTLPPEKHTADYADPRR
jgi:hypothetical protein